MDTRENHYKAILKLYKPFMLVSMASDPHFTVQGLLEAKYDVTEARLMTVEQLANLVAYMQAVVKERN